MAVGEGKGKVSNFMLPDNSPFWTETATAVTGGGRGGGVVNRAVKGVAAHCWLCPEAHTYGVMIGAPGQGTREEFKTRTMHYEKIRQKQCMAYTIIPFSDKLRCMKSFDCTDDICR